MQLLYAREYRAAARESLRGRWPMAVLVGLVASILTGFSASEPSFSIKFNFNIRKDSDLLDEFTRALYENFPPELIYFLSTYIAIVTVISIIVGIIFLILGGPISTGYAQYNMRLVSREEAGFSDLFSQFTPSLILRSFLANLIQAVIVGVATAVGLLLFVIPGIVLLFYLTYSFSMTFYILADHPDYGPWQAIKESYRMMQGHKFRLFALEFSFIGWWILAALTCGIGSLFVSPYENAAKAIFYLELAGDYYNSGAANPEIHY